MYTPQEFANKIRTKYPQAVASDGRNYADIPDEELSEKIITKYPVYKEQVNMPIKPSFKASIGGKETILPNLAKMVGNIPSDVKTLGKTLSTDTDEKINKSANLVKDIYKDRGAVQGTKDIAGGFVDTGKKVGEAFVAKGEEIDVKNNLLPIQEQTKKQHEEILEKLYQAKKEGKDTSHLVRALQYNQDTLDSINEQIGTKESRRNEEIEAYTDIAKFPIEHPVQTGVAVATLPAETEAIISSKIKPITSKIETGVNAVKNTAGNIKNAVIPESGEIMNQVARLKPTDAKKFEQMTGKTHGDYLKETGNFGRPENIIENESKKFTQSIKSVDDELAKLPGTYKDGSIEDALEELLKKAKAESGTNTKSPYLKRVEELFKKHKSTGLKMDEVNETKRLFEKNVKLGYNKLTNAEKVKQSTNIDNALREWQFKQAKELGFENIDALNKQTQTSKFLIDKLGDQLVGQNGLNGMSLTDWVVLSGGDPTAVAGFLTKKFFSSKGVQAKIAKWLSDGEVTGQVVPKTSTTAESINRTINPEGNLALPTGGSPTVENRVPVKAGPKFEQEKSVPRTSKKK